MRPQIVTILTSALCFTTTVPTLAQGPSASSGPPPPATEACPTCPPELPLDTNITILFILALAYGVYVAYKKRQATDNPQ